MKKLVFLIICMIVTPSSMEAASMFGPFKVKLVPIQVNGKIKKTREPFKIIAENSRDGRQYVFQGRRPSLELPAGMYQLKAKAVTVRFLVSSSRSTAIAKSVSLFSVVPDLFVRSQYPLKFIYIPPILPVVIV